MRMVDLAILSYGAGALVSAGRTIMRKSWRIVLYKFDGPVQVRVQNNIVTGVTAWGLSFALGMQMSVFTGWLRRKNIWHHTFGLRKRRDDKFLEA